MTTDPRQDIIERIAHSRAIESEAWWECMFCLMDGPKVAVAVHPTPFEIVKFKDRPTHNLNCPVMQARLLIGMNPENALRYDWERDD